MWVNFMKTKCAICKGTGKVRSVDMTMQDCHCHLLNKKHKKDLDKVLKESFDDEYKKAYKDLMTNGQSVVENDVIKPEVKKKRKTRSDKGVKKVKKLCIKD